MNLPVSWFTAGSAQARPNVSMLWLGRVRAGVAMVLMCCLVWSTCGCTAAQKQTTVQVVTQINANLPAVVAAANTASAVIAGLLPADAALIGVATTAFDTDASVLEGLTSAYIANPNATALTNIQTAITKLQQSVTTATLTANGIKDPVRQQQVIAALNGLLTVVTVIFARIAPTLSTSQLRSLERTHGTQLAAIRPHLDEKVLESELQLSHAQLDRYFAAAEAGGL